MGCAWARSLSGGRLLLRTSLLKPACCSGRAKPGACGTLGTFVAARAWRSVVTSQSRSGSRSSGRGAARSGQVGSKASGLKGSAAARDASVANTASNPSYHILVESWDIEKMMEEPPTDYYYDRLSEDGLPPDRPPGEPGGVPGQVHLVRVLLRHQQGRGGSGRRYKLLGHKIGRSRSSPDEERCQAVVDFPPLREKLHIQHFLGCANWLRGYLPAEYGHAAKVLGQWQKPGAEFPEGGLGAGATAGCKAFKAIKFKQMMQRHICLASFDEAAAADGSCPLEQIADASGIAVGGSVLQMTRDLSRVKVLMTHSKSLTPAQQNWPPLIQEAFAQLEVKRATRRTFGSIRTVCWTDHANLTRAQTSDIGLDPKLVRWVGEILLDGSEIRSLSGRSNPKDRDRLLEAPVFWGGYRGHWAGALGWAVGSDAVPDTADRGPVAVPVAVATEVPVRVMVVFDDLRWSEQDAALVEIQSAFQRSLPGLSVAMRGCWGPFEDSEASLRTLTVERTGSPGPSA